MKRELSGGSGEGLRSNMYLQHMDVTLDRLQVRYVIVMQLAEWLWQERGFLTQIRDAWNGSG